MSESTVAQIRPQSTLPPFSEFANRVRFKWDASDRGISVQYFGAPEDLIACGAIEPFMAVKRKKGEPKPRRDSGGHQFLTEIRSNLKLRTFSLLVARYIDDPKFAERLPGVPRGLRFPRLDWLDLHPGELHIRRTERGARIAGTADRLIAEGFPTKPLRCKRAGHPCYQDCFGYHGEEHDQLTALGYQHAWVYRLMRDYFELALEDLVEKNATPLPAPPTNQGSRRCLRLVIDNDNAVQP